MKIKILSIILATSLLILSGCSEAPITDSAPETSISAAIGSVLTELEEKPELTETIKTTNGTEETTSAAISAETPPLIASGSTCVTLETQNGSLSELPAYSGIPYVEINDNIPYFSELSCDSFEEYSNLDNLGRCGPALACVGQDIMPTEERGQIGMVKPTGWHTVKYDCVDGKYLYNRCHLIGYQLTGENANERNLITGTRYMNVDGMLPFENEIADYVKSTNNHVMYRVTPVFTGDNLLADGVQMEALSVEDNGSGVCFNVFVFNVQPGVGISYHDGESWLVDSESGSSDLEDEKTVDYIINKNTKKFHRPDCKSVSDMKPKNRKEYTGSREDLIEQGYSPCRSCSP